MPGPSLNTGGLANRNHHRKHTSRLLRLQVHTHKTHQDKFTAAVHSCKCHTDYTLIQLQQLLQLQQFHIKVSLFLFSTILLCFLLSPSLCLFFSGLSPHLPQQPRMEPSSAPSLSPLAAPSVLSHCSVLFCGG